MCDFFLFVKPDFSHQTVEKNKSLEGADFLELTNKAPLRFYVNKCLVGIQKKIIDKIDIAYALLQRYRVQASSYNTGLVQWALGQTRGPYPCRPPKCYH